MKDSPVKVRIPNDLYNELKALAEKESRSITKQVEHILKTYVRRESNG